MSSQKKEYLQELSRDDIIELSSHSFFNDKELKVETVENGIVVPPENQEFKKRSIMSNIKGDDENAPWYYAGVLSKDGNYVDISSQPAYGMRNRIMGPCSVEEKIVRFYDDTVIYMNYFIHQWGHFLIDVIGRMWYAVLKDKTTKIVYTCFQGTEDRFSGTYLQFLSLLGIGEERLVLINKPTKFKRVIVPESSIYPGLYYTKEYRSIFDIVVNNAHVSLIRRNSIYCSRSMLGKNNEDGEDTVEEVFIHNGYNPVYMEAMSLEEQIKVLNSAEKIAMINGSLAHNLLFVRNGADVFIINKTYLVNLHQFLINEITDARPQFVDAYCSPLPVIYGAGPFIIIRSKPFLKFCEDHNMKCDDELLNRVSLHRLIKYYQKWIRQYKWHLVRRQGVKNSPDGKYDKSFYEIRNYFRNKNGY